MCSSDLAHRRLLVGLDAHGGDGDDEEARKFRNGRDGEVLGGVDLLRPRGVPGVEEVAGVVVVLLVSLARSEMLHGGVSTTRSLFSLRSEERRVGKECRL